MTKAVEANFHLDDEEGVAEGAASLGPDGGPTGGGSALTPAEDDLGDDAWLGEELTDEELAALGEEDFDDLELTEEEFDALVAEGGFDVEELSALESSEAEDTLPANDSAEIESIAADVDEPEVQDPTPPEVIDADIEPAADPFEEAPAALSSEDAPIDEDELNEEAILAADPTGALIAPGAELAALDTLGGVISDFSEDEVDHRPVPRISIHAFCESPTTTALIEKAAVDRRLSKAHLTMHMGGLPKAVEQFQTSATPNLIILETLAGGSEIFGQLAELAEVCDPSTKVVIIGQVNDIILYRELIRQGISEYIVCPQSPLQIIKAIAELYVDPSAPPIGKTLAFVGARGGVGSSTVAHNVAWCTAEDYQSDTILLDLDLPFGTASLDFDQEASAGLYEALSSPERLDDVLLDRLLQKHTDHLSLFTAPSVLDRDFDLDDQAYETVIDVVRGSAPTVVVDVPHIWCNWSKRLLTTADEIVITATPDLAAFRNTKQLIDLLSAARPNDAPPTLVINQFDSKLSAVRPEQFAEHVGVNPEQVFISEPQVYAAASTNAAPIVEVSPKSKAANGFRELAAQLIGKNDIALARPKFSLAGLFRKKR